MRYKYISMLLWTITIGVSMAQPMVSTTAGIGNGCVDGETRIGETIPGFNSASGIAIDANGNLFVSDRTNHVIKKVTPTGEVSIYAGSPGVMGYADGARESSLLALPMGLAFDASGNLYFADQGSSRIRMISPAGVVSNFAGSSNGYSDGAKNSARFNLPVSIAFDASGVMYVAEESHKIRKITGGNVTTLAGSNTPGAVDGTGSAASFRIPKSIAVMLNGDLLVADEQNHKIRRVTPAGVVTTFAGTGSNGSANGALSTATFSYPGCIAVDEDENIYIADLSYKIRKINAGTSTISDYTGGNARHIDGPISIAQTKSIVGMVFDDLGTMYFQEFNMLRKISGGVVSTLAGTGVENSNVGTGTAASFNKPNGIVSDGAGNLYIADFSNHRIRLLTTDGELSSYAGTGTPGYTDGNKASAEFYQPYDVAFDNAGNMYVSHAYNSIRKITPAGIVSNFAGSLYTSAGFTNGTGNAAEFNNPKGMVIDPFNNIYVADAGNHCIRKITSSRVVTTFAGNGVSGNADGNGTSARFNNPCDLAMDLFGNIYVADAGNRIIRKISPSGEVTTVAGSGANGNQDGTGTAALFSNPVSISIDANNNLYISDAGNHNIRKMLLSTTEVSTLAGSSAGFVDATGTAAKFNAPYGIEVFQNTLYVADQNNHKIRQVNLSSNNTSPQISDQSFSIEENSMNGALIGMVLANDNDQGQTLSYSIVSGNIDNAFSIQSNTGAITVTGALDYESRTSYTLVIRVDDSGSPSLNASASITINILDLVETSVWKETNTQSLQIYPNPASAAVWIPLDHSFEVKLHDLMGNLLQHEWMETKQLDVSALKSGVYILEVQQQGQRYRTRLVIQ